jgi:hypothetical protein
VGGQAGAARDQAAWVAKLVQALQHGRVLDLAPDEDLDITQAAGWPESRQLPGEALRAALLKPDLEPDPRGLRIRAAYITGITDLADLRLSFNLRFDSCAFEQLADWSRLTVASLQLVKCIAPGLILYDAHIGGQLKLEGATLTNKDGIALALDGAEIKGGAYLNPVTVTGMVSAVDATIDGPLTLDGATLTNEGGSALALESAQLWHVWLTPATVKGLSR